MHKDYMNFYFVDSFIKAPLGIARALLRIGSVHLFVHLSVCRQNAYTKTQFSEKLRKLELCLY